MAALLMRGPCIGACAIAGAVWFVVGLWPFTLACVALGIYCWRSRNPAP